MECERDFCLKATELRLGLPGSDDDHQLCKQSSRSPPSSSSSGGSKKRALVEVDDLSIRSESNVGGDASTVEIEAMPPPAKAQIVGWPPVRSYRKNNLMNAKKSEADNTTYVKVSMDGAPYLRKMDINLYKSYPQLLKALNEMFNISIGEYSGTDCYKGSEFAPTYEDKDGDWMLVGDVPWEMFVSSCKRLRIMRGADVRGLER